MNICWLNKLSAKADINIIILFQRIFSIITTEKAWKHRQSPKGSVLKSAPYVKKKFDVRMAWYVNTSHLNLFHYRPCSVSLGASQQQNSPVSEMCVLPSSQASQQQYQPVSQSRALGFPPAQVESVNHGPSVRLAPLGQPFPGEVFAMVSHTQQMLENLNEENQSLKQELQKQNEKASRLQRVPHTFNPPFCIKMHLIF